MVCNKEWGEIHKRSIIILQFHQLRILDSYDAKITKKRQDFLNAVSV